MSTIEDRRGMMPRQPDISLSLPLDQVQLMLSVLGRAPFNEVAPLVMSIQQQAQPQVPGAPPQAALSGEQSGP